MNSCLRQNKTISKTGFTLVELSIVLVIVGLLIGGILAARSMIGTAKVISQVGQIQQFDAGVTSFFVRYKTLPGDSKAFGGDEDGLIDQSNPAHDNQVNTFACDIANFWFSLDQQQYPGSSSCDDYGTAPKTSGPTRNSPLSKMGISNSFILASGLGLGSYYGNPGNPTNYYAIISPQIPGVCCPSYNAFYTSTNTNSAVTPSDALALDQKMDDGVGITGNVISGMINNIASGYGSIYDAALAQCSNGAGKYQVQNNQNACTPLIRIGSQTGGDLK